MVVICLYIVVWGKMRKLVKFVGHDEKVVFIGGRLWEECSTLLIFKSLFCSGKVIMTIFLLGKDYSILRRSGKLVLYFLLFKLFFMFLFAFLRVQMYIESVVLLIVPLTTFIIYKDCISG